MTTRSPRFAALRASALGTLAAATLVAACESRIPTSPEIEQMDVAAAETQARKLEVISENGNVTYVVDGKQVSAEEARALGGDRIARMEMIRADSDKGASFHIVTLDGEPGDRDHLRIAGDVTGKPGDGTQNRVMLRVREPNPNGPHSAGTPRDFNGLLFIDGVLAPSTKLHTLNPDNFASIEVIKGAAAAKAHSDPKAANGIIRITTKAGAARP